MNDYQLQLREPAVLTVTSTDGTKQYKFDIFKTNRFFLEVAEKQPTNDKKWASVTEYLAKGLEVDPVLLTENVVVQFWNKILDLHKIEAEALKNEAGVTVCSQQSTPDCQVDGNDGQTSLNNVTETTSPTS